MSVSLFIAFSGPCWPATVEDLSRCGPRWCRHSFQRCHYSDFHGATLLLCHCAFRQVWSNRGHQHSSLNLLHPHCYRRPAGHNGTSSLQPPPWCSAKSLHCCVGDSDIRGCTVLGRGATGGPNALAYSHHIATNPSRGSFLFWLGQPALILVLMLRDAAFKVSGTANISFKDTN